MCRRKPTCPSWKLGGPGVSSTRRPNGHRRMAGRRRGPAGGGACGLLSVTVALMAHGALGCWAEEPTQPGESLSSGFAVPQEQAVAAQLVAEHTSVPPGSGTRVAVVLDIAPDWHIYADPPGDAG